MAETAMVGRAINGAEIVGGPYEFHAISVCDGERCPIHNPGDHHMADWPIVWRMDRGALFERRCEHGVGHPDPDSIRYLVRVTGDTWWGMHGCDGCCHDPRKREPVLA